LRELQTFVEQRGERPRAILDVVKQSDFHGASLFAAARLVAR
jgi:hypothetical protein